MENKYIDLTHSLSENVPGWDSSYKFKLELSTDYSDCVAPDLFRTQKIITPLSMGTHIDAPAHVVPGGRTIEQLSLNELIVNCCVVDVGQVVSENYVVMPEVVNNFEKKFGQIVNNSFVIFHTGWGQYWNNSEKYRNNYSFPSIHETTAELLLQRNITGLGTDTLSCDTGKVGFPTHRIILGADKYLVENLNNTHLLPAVGFEIAILPTKIQGATESPVRALAILK